MHHLLMALHAATGVCSARNVNRVRSIGAEAARAAPVIDRTCALSEVPDAIGYLEEGHARGRVVITV